MISIGSHAEHPIQKPTGGGTLTYHCALTTHFAVHYVPTEPLGAACWPLLPVRRWGAPLRGFPPVPCDFSCFPVQSFPAWFAVSFRMACHNFILGAICKPCLFIFAKLIVLYQKPVNHSVDRLGGNGKKSALPFQQLLQSSSVPPFSDRKADCDQEHGIVVGQNIGNVYGRVLCRVKIQEQDQQIRNPKQHRPGQHQKAPELTHAKG